MSKREGSAWLFLLIIFGIIAILAVLYLAARRPTALRQPSSVSLMSRVGATSLYPSLNIPGAVDPKVTQTNIHETICVSGYTRTVRPPASVTHRIKHERFEEEGLPGTLSDYELDHFIPLELGGCPDCATNLWMEPWSSPGAHEKDMVENYLHREVCSDRMSLADAQRLVAGDWFAVYERLQLEKVP